MQSIGFIGIGLMGHGMAKNLLAKGHPLAFLAHRNRRNLDDLLKLGAKEAKSPAEIASAADVVILCVTGTPQVEANVYGGLLAASRKGQIVIDCSTSIPESTDRIRADFEKKGVRFVDANEVGVAEGEGADNELSVGFVEVNVELRRRELAVTSGVNDSVFPPGIPVGRVRSADAAEGELQQDVRLVPSADLDHLRFVRVLLRSRPTTPATTPETTTSTTAPPP